MKFEIGPCEYAAQSVPPLKVIHLGRRLAPILMVLRSMQGRQIQVDEDPGDPIEGQPAPKPVATSQVEDFIGPIVDAIAHLSDDDTNYVLRECLSVTKRTRPHLIGMSLWEPHSDSPSNSLTAGEILMVAGNVLAKTFTDLLEELPALGAADLASGKAGGA